MMAEGRNDNVCMIVAAAADGAIGKGGDMIWHLRDDLRHFKHLTSGHTVIMGRNTWLSLPKRPLPGRRNIVLSRSGFADEGAETFPSLEQAIASALEGGDDMPFVIGGGQIYRDALPLASTVYLTRIDARCPEADTFFPELDPAEWQLVEAGEPITTPEGVTFRYETWRRTDR